MSEQNSSLLRRLKRTYAARGGKTSDIEDDEKSVQHNSIVQSERRQRRRVVGRTMKRAKGGRLASMQGKIRR